MAMFVRVVHRHGWQVEVVRDLGATDSVTFPSRAEALEHAKSLAPEWIEVGDIIGLDTPDQHHTWSTLRRSADGSYRPSQLKWQTRSPDG